VLLNSAVPGYSLITFYSFFYIDTADLVTDVIDGGFPVSEFEDSDKKEKTWAPVLGLRASVRKESQP
jgi:hypothetical protein